MKVPVTWLKEFVNITLPLDELAHRLTMAGLEVEEILYVGLPMPELQTGSLREVKISGTSWDPEKIVVAEILEVMPHPNADRLVLCRLNDGQQEHVVLTGAPNLYPYRGAGPLTPSLKVAYAKEGARIYDGHQPGQILTTLKRAKIRGIESYSMVCSEKELGISEEHDGVIIFSGEAPVGAPLADFIGDAVLTIALTPNIARNANILGVAREVAALTGQELRQPSFDVLAQGAPIAGRAAIEIRHPDLNPRFVLGLLENVTVQPSPYEVQRRLRLAGMRPINNIVDATNYAMLEVGEPLHAFDYDVLVARAGGRAPTIITRTAEPGERLTTLDGVDRPLDDFTVLVCDTAGALSIAGVMGGAESEVTEKTRSVLLEGAAWNFINIRKTVASQRMTSEASYRFSRGVHPAIAERGVRRCLELMRTWTGAIVAQGLVDQYPLPPTDPEVIISPQEVRRVLGIDLPVSEIAAILDHLGFGIRVEGDSLHARTPDHRLDIGTGDVGVADLMEEIARIYGYDRIPETRMSAALPLQRNNRSLDLEENIRDILAGVGLTEVVNYRLTTPERESRRLPPNSPADDKPYVHLANPIASDRTSLRHSILSSLFENLERNARLRERIALFEIGPVFLDSEDGVLPDELQRLGIVVSGPRSAKGWQPADTTPMDFYDLKGMIEALLETLHIANLTFKPTAYPVFHPGKCAQVMVTDPASRTERQLGVFGEVHPEVHSRYDWPRTPVYAAFFDIALLLAAAPDRYTSQSVPEFPPVLEDLALVVDESLPAAEVAALIRQTGGKIITSLRLFDVFRSEQIGAGKKSLAYSLAYQAPDKTLSDKDVAGIRTRIIRRLEQELGAKLRA
jgi:phenylalanyl-tRNA synthetase beta chain